MVPVHARMVRRILVCFAALAASTAASACGTGGPDASTDEPADAARSGQHSQVSAYCEVARRADARIGAELADFDPESVTPAELEQFFRVAVAESAALSDAAPVAIADELRLMSERYQAQQQVFADVEYVFADAPAEAMELVGEERKAFEAVADYNNDQCSLGHSHDNEDAGSHAEG